MSLHTVLTLVLLHTKSAHERVPAVTMLVQEMSLEVCEMLDNLSTDEALVTLRNLSNRQTSSNKKIFRQIN